MPPDGPELVLDVVWNPWDKRVFLFIEALISIELLSIQLLLILGHGSKLLAHLIVHDYLLIKDLLVQLPLILLASSNLKVFLAHMTNEVPWNLAFDV